jgi:catechol 2,3-dioxygenase-like lactoylglutathione lyase family enzyme
LAIEDIVFGSPHPVIPASDVPASLAFYTALGFEETFRDGETPTLVGIKCGPIVLLLQQESNRAFAENYWLDIPVISGIEVLYEQWQTLNIWQDGAKLGALEMKPWGRREIHIIDPAGVCVHFHEPRS